MNDAVIDVLVIGAGIHGAGIAQAAAAAGHSVGVLEQHDVAAGTSSRSSKLIHGGLRYLESGEFALVRECLAERRWLLQHAPDLVRLTPHFIPVYRDTSRRPWQLRLGLGLYALLGGLVPEVRFGTVPRHRWADLDGLRTDGLQQVFRYWDAQTDDAALTRAVALSAVRLGAELHTGARFLRAQRTGDVWTVEYRQGRQVHVGRCRVLVNAAGPWANRVLAGIRPAQPRRAVELVQGTHLVLPGVLRQGVYYTEAPADRRAVFVMPWQADRILVGTTETPFHGEPDQVRPLPEEIDYLKDTLQHYFPAWADGPVLSSFAGLRVLPAGEGRAFSRSRETLLHMDATGTLLTVYGGKLTAWHATAERVMRRLHAVLPERPRRADPRTLVLQPAD